MVGGERLVPKNSWEVGTSAHPIVSGRFALKMRERFIDRDRGRVGKRERESRREGKIEWEREQEKEGAEEWWEMVLLWRLTSSTSTHQELALGSLG